MATTLGYSAGTLSDTGEEAYRNTWWDGLLTVIGEIVNRTSRKECIVTIKEPTNETVPLIENIRFPGTLKKLSVRAVGSGATATIQININSTPATVSSDATHAATTTQAVYTFDGANTFVAGDEVSAALTDVTNCDYLVFNLWYDRTGAGTA